MKICRSCKIAKYADVFTGQWFDIEYANKYEDAVYLTEIDVTDVTNET